MKRHLKKYFIPHAGNNYHPHILHPKRALLYSGVLFASKVILVATIIALPLPVFVMPDVLAIQQERLVELVNNMRRQEGRSPLTAAAKLNYSSGLRATDMADHSYFSHTSPNGQVLANFLGQAGYAYQTAGENLAMGFGDAETLFNAWVKSPSHYANLIDNDYADTGVGLASGMYNGAPTVYVAEHFGTAKLVAAALQKSTPVKKNLAIAPLPESKPITPPQTQQAPWPEAVAPITSTTPPISLTLGQALAPPDVLGETIVSEPLTIDPTDSNVTWQQADGGAVVTAQAYLKGAVQTATVEVQEYSFQLEPGATRADGYTRYAGTYLLPLTPRELFRVVIQPSLVVDPPAGETLQSSLPWIAPLIVTPTPIEKYLLARKTLPLISTAVQFAQGVYWFFLGFFFVALILSIVIEFKKQHPHVILQTLALIGLISTLLIS